MEHSKYGPNANRKQLQAEFTVKLYKKICYFSAFCRLLYSVCSLLQPARQSRSGGVSDQVFLLN